MSRMTVIEYIKHLVPCPSERAAIANAIVAAAKDHVPQTVTTG